MARKCGPPKTVSVRGYTRQRRRKKRKRPAAPKGRYYVVSDGSSSCGHHHRKASGALRCQRALERSDRAYSARYSTRRKKVKRKRYTIEIRGRG